VQLQPLGYTFGVTCILLGSYWITGQFQYDWAIQNPELSLRFRYRIGCQDQVSNWSYPQYLMFVSVDQRQ
jgi:hypothetical protein